MYQTFLILVFICAAGARVIKKHQADVQKNLEYGDLPEGDLMVRPGMEWSLNQADPLNAVYDKRLLWPQGIIPYIITPGDFNATQEEKILAGIRDLVNLTKHEGEICLNIIPRTNELNYVRVYKGSGCSSYLGRVGGEQTLSLADGCVNRHGTIMHEFLHAAGFHHEHKRGDRDDWVTINWENIEPGTQNNFVKLEEGVTVDHLGTIYHYESVMHYGAYAFAVDPEVPTIIPHLEEGWALMGQRTNLSALDIERTQILYSCKTTEESKYFKHLK